MKRLPIFVASAALLAAIALSPSGFADPPSTVQVCHRIQGAPCPEDPKPKCRCVVLEIPKGSPAIEVHRSHGDAVFFRPLDLAVGSVVCLPCSLFPPDAANWAPCAGDLDGDGVVGAGDLLPILDAWGSPQGLGPDLDGDGETGFGDIVELVLVWGPCVDTEVEHAHVHIED
jgi:hypothetical protein